MTVTYRPLSFNAPTDVNELQTLLEAASDYYLLVEGKRPGPGAAARVLTLLPPGTSMSDKHTLGIESSGKLIGCLDVIKGYPAPETAFIGLLLFPESERGRSRGVDALKHAEALAGEWGCRRLELAVVDTNMRALKFWKREGFSEFHRKPSERHIGDAIFMERTV